jgi:hypothetical protein
LERLQPVDAGNIAQAVQGKTPVFPHSGSDERKLWFPDLLQEEFCPRPLFEGSLGFSALAN